MRIGIARLWHEANSFCVHPTGMAEFRSREWLKGEEAPALYRGTATEIGGALAWAEKRGDVEFVFSRLASAPPGGPVEQALLDGFIAEVLADPALDGLDGLYLSLHGACFGTVDEDPEATLAEGLRRRFPGLPIVASFDIHACLSDRLCAQLNGATVYRTYPHVDMDAAAVRALGLLAAMIETGKRPKVLLRTIGRVLPSFNMRTAPGLPMTEAVELAIAEEAKAAPGEILAVYPYGSFAYADISLTNAGAVVTAENQEHGAAAAKAVAGFLFENRQRFRPDLPSAADALAAKPWADGRRVAILEPSDNPLSGGQGDTPGLFAAAMAADLPEGTVFAFFADPDAIAEARAAGIGGRLALSLGGKVDPRFGPPIPCEARVLALTDGRFVNRGPMERGMPVDLGPTALIEVGRMRVVLTTGCQSPNDVAYFELHGIDLSAVPLLLAKAKNHFMAGLGGAFDLVRQCDTAGPAMADARQLPFRNLPAERLSLD